MTTAEQFGAAMDAFGAEWPPGTDTAPIFARIREITPAGVRLRPAFNGSTVDVELAAGDGASVAKFYLKKHRNRVRDPQLTAIAWAAINAIAATVEPPAPRWGFEVYDSRTEGRMAFYPVDVADEATARHAAHRAAAALNPDDAEPYKAREVCRPAQQEA